MNAEPRGADLRGGAMVGSRPVDLDEVGHGCLKNVVADEVREAEHVTYANFGNGTVNGRDLLVRKERGRYVFRLIYPQCDWVRAADLPPLYQTVALSWLRLRRRGAI